MLNVDILQLSKKNSFNLSPCFKNVNTIWLYNVIEIRISFIYFNIMLFV